MQDDTLIALEREHQELMEKLASGELSSSGEKLAQAGKRLKELAEEITAAKHAAKLAARRKEAQAMLEDPDADAEMRALAAAELEELDAAEATAKRKSLKKETAIIEVRPGTGGDEAGLFAADLVRMYTRFAERRGWKVEVLEQTSSDLGGIKSMSLGITGPGAFALLQYEAGVHRVQRVPETEKAGRIHTSAATVVVLREVQKEEFSVPASELRIDTMRAGGPGGQFVNRRESAVRVLHIPTGQMVYSQHGRNQQDNKDLAMKILLARLADLKAQEEAAAAGAARKAQIGGGDRSEKIRTYNFPQDRVTDHRINETWHNLPAILDGDIEDIVEALREAAKEA
jgi:peptide chain release factor 1